ncbi:hypothetical protein ACJRO7_024342 [Eucalyptus globulus]|uniref:Glycerol-3-phosphate acyltransferase RAM2/GPAT1-8 HAD-like domain-containing protein n=1 Tax=Eucalyptus globulus TaxID=34317 RepID=A0ABD3KAH7_EUCGL
MAGKSMAKSISSFLTRVLFGRTKATANIDAKPTQMFANIAKTSLEGFSSETLVFDFEGTLLRSSSLFPYFMLVAFEAGGFLRTLVLLLAYPFACMLNQETMLRVMVFICFVGVRRESFRLGSTVLPKFFLEDLGHEAFDGVMGFGRRVVVTRLPRITVEDFLKEWLGVDTVVGGEVAVFRGRFTGLMEKNKAGQELIQLLGEGRLMGSRATCVGCFSKPWPFDYHQLLAHCKRAEPSLLRFSPLSARESDSPHGYRRCVSMFYGSTVHGPKCWDPVFHFMNPNPSYALQILEKFLASCTREGSGKSVTEVANYVRS